MIWIYVPSGCYSLLRYVDKIEDALRQCSMATGQFGVGTYEEGPEPTDRYLFSNLDLSLLGVSSKGIDHMASKINIDTMLFKLTFFL